MTWNGAQGFQTPVEPESFTVANFGTFGSEHTERGLTCTYANIALANSVHSHPPALSDVEFEFSGHMTPRMYRFPSCPGLWSWLIYFTE